LENHQKPMILQGRSRRVATLICSLITDRTSITDSIRKRHRCAAW